MKTQNASGFTLIELAVVVTVIGALMGGLALMLKPYLEKNQITSTEVKLQRISDALSDYVIKFNRLPCPADPNPVTEPFGSPRNSTATGLVTTNPCSTAGFVVTDYKGIIPFSALGLGEAQVKDAWGNFITYAVDPILAGDTGAGNDVHAMCRTPVWVVEGANMNEPKAKFCCPARAVQPTIQITDARTAGKSILGRVRSTVAGDYALPNVSVPYPVIPTPTERETQMIAFVLISHGKNGDGAYLRRTASTRAVTADAAAEESENRDNNLNFVTRPLTLTRDTNYFDDIMLWRTNEQVINNFGNNSCVRP